MYAKHFQSIINAFCTIMVKQLSTATTLLCFGFKRWPIYICLAKSSAFTRYDQSCNFQYFYRFSQGKLINLPLLNSQTLHFPLFKSASGERGFYYRTVKIWNSLDNELKLSKDVLSFKRKLKSKLLCSA